MRNWFVWFWDACCSLMRSGRSGGHMQEMPTIRFGKTWHSLSRDMEGRGFKIDPESARTVTEHKLALM